MPPVPAPLKVVGLWRGGGGGGRRVIMILLFHVEGWLQVPVWVVYANVYVH